jgi:hypothetical protein
MVSALTKSGRTAVAWALVALVGCYFWGSAAAAVPCDPPAQVGLPAGSTPTEVRGGISRGELACFTIAGHLGQHMSVSQPDPGESNIVMQIYRPPWAIKHTEDGIRVRGQALPGVKEGDDAKGWGGTLPATGNYLLVLGTSWGGGEYHVQIKLY